MIFPNVRIASHKAYMNRESVILRVCVCVCEREREREREKERKRESDGTTQVIKGMVFTMFP